MLNFNQVRVFYHVAKNLSFTLAAKELFITQPAVTAQIKAFEDYSNLKLYKRRGRNIYLTEAGKTLYQYVRQIFEYETEIENVIEDLNELKRGVLRLGTSKAYARYFMPSLLSHFHSVYPDIKIFLDEGSSLDMIHSLLSFRNEVAIVAMAQDHPDVSFTPFRQEELLLILSPGHPLAGKNEVSFRDLANEPIIMKESGSGTRKVINEIFARYNFSPNILMETSNTGFIKQLVQRGDGISFLVRESVIAELREGKLATASMAEEKLFLNVCIAHFKGQQLSRPAQAFLDTLGQLPSGGRPVERMWAIISDGSSN